MTNNTQLPAEVVHQINAEANSKYNEHGLIRMISRREGYRDGATVYVIKLHQAKQENEQLKTLLIEAADVIVNLLNGVVTDNARLVLSAILDADNEALSAGEGPTEQEIETEITRRWNSILFNPEGIRTKESYRKGVINDLKNQKEDKQ